MWGRHWESVNWETVGIFFITVALLSESLSHFLSLHTLVFCCVHCKVHFNQTFRLLSAEHHRLFTWPPLTREFPVFTHLSLAGLNIFSSRSVGSHHSHISHCFLQSSSYNNNFPGDRKIGLSLQEAAALWSRCGLAGCGKHIKWLLGCQIPPSSGEGHELLKLKHV